MARFREGKLTDAQLEVFLEKMFIKGRRVRYDFDTEDDLTWVYINAGTNGLCLRNDGCSSGLLNGTYKSNSGINGGEGTIDLHWIQVPRPWVAKLMEKFMPGGGARARKEEVEAAISGITVGLVETDTPDMTPARVVLGVVFMILVLLALSVVAVR